MARAKILFLTEQSVRHQEAAVAAAPPECSIVVLPHTPRDVVLAELPAADFLISERRGALDEQLITAGTRLRLIQRLGSLTYDIDLAAARRAQIPVCAMPVPGCQLAAEHMVMQMLALVKRLNEVTAIANAAGSWGRPARRTDENTFAYNWSRRTNIGALSGCTIAILGFGEIGVELARRLAAFRPAQILYYKRQRLPVAVEVELAITYAEPETLYARADILCNLLPYTPATDRLLNATVFARMKAGAFLVSCGSGSVIDERALADAVRGGHLAGAALDTFEWEPLRPDNPLLPLARDPAQNVLLTAHVAAGAPRSHEISTPRRAADFENVRRVLAGQPLVGQVA